MHFTVKCFSKILAGSQEEDLHFQESKIVDYNKQVNQNAGQPPPNQIAGRWIKPFICPRRSFNLSNSPGYWRDKNWSEVADMDKFALFQMAFPESFIIEVLIPQSNKSIKLSWNYQQNVEKISHHFGFVADFSKIVCHFTMFDIFCVWVVCQHCVVHIDMRLSDIAFYFSKYFLFYWYIHIIHNKTNEDPTTTTTPTTTTKITTPKSHPTISFLQGPKNYYSFPSTTSFLHSTPFSPSCFGWFLTTLCLKGDASSSKRSKMVWPLPAQPIEICARLWSGCGAHGVVGTVGISSEEMPIHWHQRLQL